MTFIIREATLEDIDAVEEVYRETDLFHQAGAPRAFRNHIGDPRPRDFIADVIASDEQGLFVAESEGRVVGMAQCYMSKTPDYPILVPRKFAVLEDLAVTEEFRRQGIGKALMARFEAWAREKGADNVQLQVWAFNESAIEVYRGLGYEFACHRMWKFLG